MRRPTLIALAVTAAAALPALAASASWRHDAKPADVRRLERLDEAWHQATAEARRAGQGRALAALGRLADPKAALASRPEPTPGTYRCRTVKLGSGGRPGGLGLVAYGWFACKVDLSPGGDLTLTKTTGSQRPMGHLYPDSRRRPRLPGRGGLGDRGARRLWPRSRAGPGGRRRADRRADLAPRPALPETGIDPRPDRAPPLSQA
ncbi:DUF4893 domain-containing protein [Phenylobacterium sp. J367]|nr:DUF4893 domain-containing protein [Phenylobacterium sp. J367]MCR5877254.1 DUF4893 domain-containing protein [Phenylobacterium sp. J367]